MYEVSWCIWTPIPGNACIGCWPWSWITTGKGRNELWVWWGARQYDCAQWCFPAITYQTWSGSTALLNEKPLAYYMVQNNYTINCFAKEICMLMDHIPLVLMISKDAATLLQHLKCIMLHIQQYNLHMLYKHGPDLYTVDWISRNKHVENKDQEMQAWMSMCMWAVKQWISWYAHPQKIYRQQPARMQTC